MSRFQILGLAGAMAAVAFVGALTVVGRTDRPPVVSSTANPSSRSPVAGDAFRSTRYGSTRYGYSVSLPEGWDVEAATETWQAGDGFIGGAVDRFDETDASSPRPRFVVAAADIPAGVAPDDWIDEARPSRLEGFGSRKRCGVRGSLEPTFDPWQPRTLAGYKGFIRDACGYVDGVVVVGGRGYVFSAEGAVPTTDIASASPETHAAFDRLVSTFVAAVEAPFIAPTTEAFTSMLFGYAVRYPTGWEAIAASTTWTPDGGLSWSQAGDRFEDPGSPSPWGVSIVSAAIAADMTEQEWIDRYLPERYERHEYGGVRCPGSNMWLDAAPVGWKPRPIAGRAGLICVSCGHVDGVVVADDRAYVITAEGPIKWTADPVTPAAFDTFAATLELRPFEAADGHVAPSSRQRRDP